MPVPVAPFVAAVQRKGQNAAISVRCGFGDPDGTLLSAYSWANAGDARPAGLQWTNQLNGLTCISGAAKTDSGDSLLHISTLPVAKADVDIQCRFYHTWNNVKTLGAVWRYTNNDNYWCIRSDSITNQYFIIERQGGVETVRATGAVVIDPFIWYTVRVRVAGQIVTAWLNGGTEISYNLASFNQAATIHGIAATSSGGVTYALVDDFALDEVTS